MQCSAILENRVSITTTTEAAKTEYEEHVKDDERRFRNKFKAVHTARERKDDSWRSEAAVKLEKWCREGAGSTSWAAWVSRAGLARAVNSIIELKESN